MAHQGHSAIMFLDGAINGNRPTQCNHFSSSARELSFGTFQTKNPSSSVEEIASG
jgi:hypothetical protein